MDPLPLTTPAAWIVICVMRLSQPKILWEDTELVCIQDVHAVDVIIQIQDPRTSTNLQEFDPEMAPWHGDS